MQNKDQQLPSSELADKMILSTEFPEGRPIFWGPNQNTVYPSTYAEPTGWRPNDVLHIPKVARIIIGGKVSQRRMFPIGYVNVGPVTWHTQYGINNPITVPPLIQYRHVSAFIQTDELPSGSSLNALGCLNLFWDGTQRDKTGAQLILSNQYAGYSLHPANDFGFATTYANILPNSGIAPIGAPELLIDPDTGSAPDNFDPSIRWSYTKPATPPLPLFGFISTVWLWIYHQVNESGNQYGCLGTYKSASLFGWDQPREDPGTGGQEFVLGNRSYIPGLVIP